MMMHDIPTQGWPWKTLMGENLPTWLCFRECSWSSSKHGKAASGNIYKDSWGVKHGSLVAPGRKKTGRPKTKNWGEEACGRTSWRWAQGVKISVLCVNVHLSILWKRINNNQKNNSAS